MPVDSFKPVGMFDSGLGGLTLVSESLRQIPGEKIIYFGDTANAPYGDRSPAQLISFADRIVSFLVSKGVKAVVDACNSTSSVALDFLRSNYNVPFVGVIEAGAREALKATRSGRIGVIATKATIESGAHAAAVKSLDPSAEVFGQACPLFVPLVEAGKVNCIEARAASEKYLRPLQDEGVDTLILGCTHYPFLVPVINEILSEDVELVDPAAETIRELKILLQVQRNLNPGSPMGYEDHDYFVSGDPDEFKRIGQSLLGSTLGEIHREILLNESVDPGEVVHQ